MPQTDNRSIVNVNHHEKRGGAAFIARTLFQGFREAGHLSKFLVQYKSSNDPDVWTLTDPNNNKYLHAILNSWLSGIPAQNNTLLQKWLRKAIRTAIDPKEALNYISGKENTHYKAFSRRITREGIPFDILQLHNLHGGYFGIDYLPFLSSQYPLVITLHDTWLFSGHCAYSIECDRWKSGCGACPDLKLYPPLERDNTARNWRHKLKLFQKSRIYPIGVSQWVLDQAMQSMMAPAIHLPKVIYNGIDLSIFYPGYKQKARKLLELPTDQKIVLFVASSIQKNTYKDFSTFQKTFEFIGENWKGNHPVLFLGLGGSEELSLITRGAELLVITKISDPKRVAAYYQAADVYLHTARADTFPTTILEAMACGLPVVATRVGGIPEQVLEGETGFLADYQDSIDHGRHILFLLNNQLFANKLGRNAAHIATQKYDQTRMISDYLSYYEEVLDDWK
ncbi:MAG: glycosyltransferase [Anaerolineaceae bacterium]|nr:glycosyltransferase [Anaerolineaceae bacterium]